MTTLDMTLGRVTNEQLEQAVAVWFKDEDQVAGDTLGPIWIQVGGNPPDADGFPMPQGGELIPFHVPERLEWFEASFAEDLAKELGLPVVWS